MDLPSERDPLFARYNAAWATYLAIQAERHDDGSGLIPYRRAASNPIDVEMQTAAIELRAARDAFLTDLDPD